MASYCDGANELEGNPNWSARKKQLWRMAKNYVALDFHFPREDPHYAQNLKGSVKLVFKKLCKGYTTDLQYCDDDPVITLTLDHLPFNYECLTMTCWESPHLGSLFEMNEKFIVALDPNTQRLNYWSRRTLKPLKLDQDFQVQRYPKKLIFKLSGNYLIYGEVCKVDGADYDVIKFTKVDLDAQCRGTNDKAVKMTTSVRVTGGQAASIIIRHIDVAEDFVLLILMYSNDKSKYHVSVLHLMEEAETDMDLRASMLPIPVSRLSSSLHCFFDADYLVVRCSDMKEPNGKIYCEFRTFSLRPIQPGHPVELKFIASFKLENVALCDYKDGFLVADLRTGLYSIVDVAKGALFMEIMSPLNVSGLLCREMRLTRDYLVVSRDGSFTHENSLFVWDFQSIRRREVEETRVHPNCAYNTSSGLLHDFKVDELGIVSLMQKGPRKGFQVLSFLPICNGCKRVTKPAGLKRCSRCKAATYCSKECQKADWNSTHKSFCKFGLVEVIPGEDSLFDT